MIDSAAIRELAARAKAQLLDGVEALKCGDITLAELHFSLSLITQRKLLGALEGADDAASPQPPLRKLCLVGDREPVDPDDADLQPWMAQKFGGPNDGNAA